MIKDFFRFLLNVCDLRCFFLAAIGGAAGLGAIASGIGSIANIGFGIAGLKQQQQALKDARKQQDLENKRYDTLKQQQDAFMGEVNDSASSFSLKSKEPQANSITGDTEPMPTERM